MKICIHQLILASLLVASSTYAAKDKFWKNCPGSACPANVPDSGIDLKALSEKKYEDMNEEQLKQERKHLQDSIKYIDHEENQRRKR